LFYFIVADFKLNSQMLISQSKLYLTSMIYITMRYFHIRNSI